jgi:4-hydroxymandelate oxidase
LPAGLQGLADHAPRAASVLDAAVLAWVDGGGGDGRAVRANEAAWQAWRLWSRVLQPLQGGHTHTSLLGRSLAHPIIVAPTACHRLLHPDAEIGTACATSAQQAGYVLSLQASTRLEEVARAVAQDNERGPLWMQIYLQPDRGWMQALLSRIESAGYEAIVLTVDAPVHGVRDAERRHGFALPPGLGTVNLPSQADAGPQTFDGLLQRAPTWDDVAWLLAHTRLPVWLKGVLHPQDALQAQAMGACGVIVSNHGGRTLDAIVPTVWALPRVVEAVGPQWPVLVDGGLRRGSDVFKALALGARAVMVGRPVMHGLVNAGALGAAHVLRLLRDELQATMALCGCRTLDDIHPGLLVPA